MVSTHSGTPQGCHRKCGSRACFTQSLANGHLPRTGELLWDTKVQETEPQSRTLQTSFGGLHVPVTLPVHISSKTAQHTHCSLPSVQQSVCTRMVETTSSFPANSSSFGSSRITSTAPLLGSLCVFRYIFTDKQEATGTNRRQKVHSEKTEL